MRNADTSLGGSGSLFQSTIWTEVLAAGDPTHPQVRERLDQVIRRYWRPVYSYIRVAWRVSNEDAKDLAQTFFSRLLEKNEFAKVRPEKGSLRGYLKTALKHFLINARKYEELRKFADLPLNEEIAGAASGESPDQAHDREWFKCVMETSLEALKNRLAAQGKQAHYELFSTYYFAPPGSTAPTHDEMAKRLGIPKSDVNNYLAYCRRELLRVVRECIREYVGSDEEVEDELRQAGVQ